MPVEGDSLIVLRMDGERSNAADVRSLQSPLQGIEKKSRPDALPLPIDMDRQARQHHQRYRVARHSFRDPLRRVGMPDFADHERVKTNNLAMSEAEIGERRARLLGLQRVSGQKPVKFRLPAGEFLDRMSSMQLFNAQRVRHGSGSKTEGSRNSRSSRG